MSIAERGEVDEEARPSVDGLAIEMVAFGDRMDEPFSLEML